MLMSQGIKVTLVIHVILLMVRNYTSVSRFPTPKFLLSLLTSSDENAQISANFSVRFSFL